MNLEKFKIPCRYPKEDRSIWTEIVNLSEKYEPINLGLGCSDNEIPEWISDTLVAQAKKRDSFIHQYARSFGHLKLVNVLSTLYEKVTNIKFNPRTEILVTIGACQALYVAIQGLIDVGDEVIIIEPYFDSYDPVIKICGGIPKYIPLRPKCGTESSSSADWCLDDQELENLFNAKTKMIILNNPSNPTGKVFSRKELEKIAQLCVKWNVVCVSDEVYEWLVFDDKEHIRVCTLPGMKERTLTVSSAGKAFFLTGWRIGWVYGPEYLIRNLMTVHGNVVYSCPTLLQETVADLLEKEIPKLGTDESFFRIASKELEQKRDFCMEIFKRAGMKTILPEGGLFLTVDWTVFENKIDLSNETDASKDFRFIKWTIKNKGLLTVPSSVFYSGGNKALGENYIRICFLREHKILEKVAEIMNNWK